MLKNVKDYDGAPYYSVRPERVSKVDTNNAIDEALDNDDEEAMLELYNQAQKKPARTTDWRT